MFQTSRMLQKTMSDKVQNTTNCIGVHYNNNQLLKKKLANDTIVKRVHYITFIKQLKQQATFIH